MEHQTATNKNALTQACFLTRGDLYQSWEHGAQVFDQLLLDADWAINNGTILL